MLALDKFSSKIFDLRSESIIQERIRYPVVDTLRTLAVTL